MGVFGAMGVLGAMDVSQGHGRSWGSSGAHPVLRPGRPRPAEQGRRGAPPPRGPAEPPFGGRPRGAGPAEPRAVPRTVRGTALGSSEPPPGGAGAEHPFGPVGGLPAGLRRAFVRAAPHVRPIGP
eukprot:gene15095-biopygen5167